MFSSNIDSVCLVSTELKKKKEKLGQLPKITDNVSWNCKYKYYLSLHH